MTYYRASLVAQMVRICLQLRRPASIPGLGRSPGEGNGYPLQYPCPTPGFLPWEFHGQRGLVGYSLWGCKESDTTEWLSTALSLLHLLLLPRDRSFRPRAWVFTAECLLSMTLGRNDGLGGSGITLLLGQFETRDNQGCKYLVSNKNNVMILIQI